MKFQNYFVEHLVVPSVVQFFLVFSIIGVAVGIGLIVANQPTLRVLGVLNRWVSTRRWLRAAEIPRDTTMSVQRYRVWIGAFFVIAAVYSLFGLVAKFEISALVQTNKLGTWQPVAVWLLQSLRWFLVLASVAAAVVGLMMVFSPGALQRFEARANEWHSSRKALGGIPDTMYMPLDKWVEHYPRIAGFIITAGAFGVALGSVMVLVRLK
jgi:hypothetical protein